MATELSVVNKLVTFAGCFYLLKLFLYLAYHSWSGFRTFVWSRIRRPVDLKAKYGPWAVVTGCTEGIGKEFSYELAKRGMNLVLISRSEQKLELTASEIKEKFDVEVKWIKADFSHTNVYDYIKRELAYVDVGILVNNVGIANECMELIIDASEEFLLRIVNINIIATIMNTKIIIDKMKRKNKGLIINIGSMCGVIPAPYMGVYSATKAFMDHYSACLEAELSNFNIKVKCFRPGFVKTNLLASMSLMVKYFVKYFPPMITSPKRFAKSAVATLNTDVTFTSGYWQHALCLFIAQTIGNRYFNTRSAMFMIQWAGGYK